MNGGHIQPTDYKGGVGVSLKKWKISHKNVTVEARVVMYLCGEGIGPFPGHRSFIAIITQDDTFLNHSSQRIYCFKSTFMGNSE